MGVAQEVIAFHVLGVIKEAGRKRFVARNAREKCITLHSCISATDEVQLNEQDKSIGTGSQTEFNVPAERYWGYRTL